MTTSEPRSYPAADSCSLRPEQPGKPSTCGTAPLPRSIAYRKRVTTLNMPDYSQQSFKMCFQNVSESPTPMRSASHGRPGCSHPTENSIMNGARNGAQPHHTEEVWSLLKNSKGRKTLTKAMETIIYRINPKAPLAKNASREDWRLLTHTVTALTVWDLRVEFNRTTPPSTRMPRCQSQKKQKL